MTSNFSKDSLQVLYEDNHLIAVFKPAGIPTEGAVSSKTSLLEVTRAWVKQAHAKPGNVFLGLVHRLDQSVSGVVVFAKTSKGASRLGEQFRGRQVRKIYRAVVQGSTPPSKKLESYLSTEALPRVKVHAVAGEGRKLAVLVFRTLETREGMSLLEIELETGRKHQIRAQLAHIGHPIAGDRRYGSKSPGVEGGIALVAQRLELRHPTKQEEMIRIEVPRQLNPLRKLWS